MRRFHHLAAAAVVCFLTGLAGSAIAAEMNVDGMIKYRQNVMRSLGGHAGAVDRILRGHVPQHAEQLELHARALREVAETILTLFPKDTIPPEAVFAGATVETDALESILEKPDKFEMAGKDTQEAAQNFLKAVEGEDKKAIAEAFDKLGKSCKGCHDDFRKEKK